MIAPRFSGISSADPANATQIPLVSVGIPTYNRADGLRRTLTCICEQTYASLDILVSDNNSPDPAVRATMEEFAARDSRIRLFFQPQNIGAHQNFQFVLRESLAQHFMWAADDDEWLPEFIERCMATSTDGTVMSEFAVRNRVTLEDHFVQLFDYGKPGNRLADVGAFLSNPQPTLFYGVHKKSAIGFFLRERAAFDFSDCYFLLRVLVQHGIHVVHEQLHIAGIDAPAYQIKYMNSHKKSFQFGTFFLKTAWLFIWSMQFSIVEKKQLLMQLYQLIKTLMIHHEQESCAGRRLFWETIEVIFPIKSVPRGTRKPNP